MITVEHIPAEDPTNTNYNPILSVRIGPHGSRLREDCDVVFNWFDDGSAGVDIVIGNESNWLSLSEEDTLALQAALNKAFPV